MDIVERLRERADFVESHPSLARSGALEREAADEIEKLRRALATALGQDVVRPEQDLDHALDIEIYELLGEIERLRDHKKRLIQIVDDYVERLADRKNGYQMCVRFRDAIEEVFGPNAECDPI